MTADEMFEKIGYDKLIRIIDSDNNVIATADDLDYIKYTNINMMQEIKFFKTKKLIQISSSNDCSKSSSVFISLEEFEAMQEQVEQLKKKEWKE